MSSNFKLAATTAVLLTTLSFTATAGSTRYFADVTPKNYATETNLEWDFEALIRHEDDGEKRLIIEIGGLNVNDQYNQKSNGALVDLVDQASCETIDDEGVNVTFCDLNTPFVIKVFAEGSMFKYLAEEAAWEETSEDTDANRCGGAGIVLRTDKGDSVPDVQPGDKVVISLKKAKTAKVGVGFFSEEEPVPTGTAPDGCPIEPIELEEEE
ncbi:hypothetical protein ACQKPX_02705 [Photobacterium sp. DNB23_23_1]|uniref:Uncharacterized protein n=1 Tax=Photobacterium pectinilyticum TaxID=2906793 RepID=A0ABT1N144_9GAMM|nr:hypothetical protein [Photobacterium sp. ZSDE20]MCQ1058455.1 hypothetical protein [Photobacterium sp. ZSDE20]MDD1823178.1 hypothetical protein [Photobacterium sp. ZSDE20]